MSVGKPNLHIGPLESPAFMRAAIRAGVNASALEQPVPEEAPALKTIERVAQDLDSYMKSVGRSIEFKVDKDSGRTVISVRDSHTGELIRQIPGEEVLRLARGMAANSLLVSITA